MVGRRSFPFGAFRPIFRGFGCSKMNLQVAKPSNHRRNLAPDINNYPPPKINMTMEKQPFEDVPPIKNGDFPLSRLFSGGYPIYPGFIYVTRTTSLPQAAPRAINPCLLVRLRAAAAAEAILALFTSEGLQAFS